MRRIRIQFEALRNRQTSRFGEGLRGGERACRIVAAPATLRGACSADRLVYFFNGGLGALAHVAAPGSDRAELCGRASDLLYKYIITIEEKPTPIRFLTFTDCVRAMLRMRLLDVPSSALSLDTKMPTKGTRSG